MLKVIRPASSSAWVTFHVPDQLFVTPTDRTGAPNSSTCLPLG